MHRNTTYFSFDPHEGTGEQGGSAIQEKEIVGSSDNLEELSELGIKMYPRPTSWEWDGWAVKINLSTEEGKRLWAINAEENRLRFERLYKDVAEPPDDYTISKYGDITIYMKKNNALDDAIPISSESPKMGLMMPSEGLSGSPVPPVEYFTASIDPKTNEFIAPIQFWKPNTNKSAQ